MSETQLKTNERTALRGSTWFITGIGRGLGRHIALEVLRGGGRVAGTVRSRAHAEELHRQFPGQLWTAELDLSDFAKIPATFQAAAAHFGRIHAVVNNAAYSLLGAAEELELEAINHIIATNMTGSIELARAAVAHMRPLGGGRLLQVSSSAGQAAFAGLSLYCATKWGIEGFIESLAQEVAGFGIQTTLVEPGTIRTDFGSSGVLSPELDAYRDGPVGMMRQMATGGYLAPGDPAKMAKAIVATFEAEAAPPRLALGQDAYGYIKAALLSRLDQLEKYKVVDTDCDPAPDAAVSGQ
ncbi:SDR family oxidoreductase [Paludibaculum fermentans]|uniref:SDR family oxidoreductase n=1 Tax=Paludibaculum fermentans TaxID=1473598 RepID=A0A7S7NW91_PALFE|nr:SDR family oxidoreductase [Paludibaculum fermentans]QOY90344.1 SDR family oxidoreductase [Paludibaculum fermentans]